MSTKSYVGKVPVFSLVLIYVYSYFYKYPVRITSLQTERTTLTVRIIATQSVWYNQFFQSKNNLKITLYLHLNARIIESILFRSYSIPFHSKGSAAAVTAIVALSSKYLHWFMQTNALRLRHTSETLTQLSWRHPGFPWISWNVL